MNLTTSALHTAINDSDLIQRYGYVDCFEGLTLESKGPEVHLGELCKIESKDDSIIHAEVVGFKNERNVLMPYQSTTGIRLGAKVFATGEMPSVLVGDALIGRVVNAFGEPIDGCGSFDKSLLKKVNIFTNPINPMERDPISKVFETGVNLVDSFITVGKGQRLGILAGSGVGKSSLMGEMAKRTKADINVIALIGERGREVSEFIKEVLGDGINKSVIVVATADEPALMRSRAAYTATAIAEYFCAKGKDVLLMMDSITRLAMAQRDIGLASGELPSVRGYTPSCFTVLPKLIERAGNFLNKGSITALYSVLVEGDDLNEPVTDNLRAILDGHIVLNRRLANLGVYPAIDLLQSLSRLKKKITNLEMQSVHENILAHLATYEISRDMVEIGAYNKGDNPKLDNAIQIHNKITSLIKSDVAHPLKRDVYESELKNLLVFASERREMSNMKRGK